MQTAAVGTLKVGTASWTDKTLLESGWYPSDATSAEDRLKFYAEQFPLVEVDSTYYTPPSERNSEAWAARTPEGFTFNIKAFSLLTQHPTRVSALYKELRPETEKKSVYLKDLDDKAVDEVWARFLSALNPLADAGKLGVILLQFPPWFTARSSNRDYILQCKERVEPWRIAVEFRHKSWFEDEKNTDRTLDFLRSYGLPFVCVDMPQGHTSSIPPVVAATSDLAVVRFHGHSDKWTSKDIYERFGYEYSEPELREWAPKLEGLAEKAETVHVLMNNCYRNYAQVNARQLADMLPDA
ncbi:uncharacterized protein YecE (DUF72 family) [Motilibacter peucedani]|uniref:Uncharacterized protein YecE (DUF72 family) n=1 Tax=Motilibacter peucedani TaxID=598650 RepID=A0A420XRK1_9ACTN|nr:uncharacterized protein YecE (DUF72 family) [Motilibacter peucedani]